MNAPFHTQFPPFPRPILTGPYGVYRAVLPIGEVPIRNRCDTLSEALQIIGSWENTMVVYPYRSQDRRYLIRHLATGRVVKEIIHSGEDRNAIQRRLTYKLHTAINVTSLGMVLTEMGARGLIDRKRDAAFGNIAQSLLTILDGRLDLLELPTRQPKPTKTTSVTAH
jgi:hypothetical protein